MKTITLKRPIIMPSAIAGGAEQRWDVLSLREIEAGDVCDAGRELPDNASQSEMQLRVAAKCADLPFVVLRKLKPVDIVQIETWWREEWSSVEAKPGTETEENPSKAGGTKPQS
ncbi:hypothetical protein ASD64_07030 [Mesorhizobium sp. Root157]|uniref:phage tail assembly protein n=1 Tax=Mesorhizobium sp. Root157 TaxID=1736477 RepID=UPI0006FB4BF8|nr:phage tail assembly protein [Mesorhizobium sp. Root157]KQZ87188.1 hypothetical protein ASD64_07030 [Mesorhizobium sp. Root157]